MVPPKSKAQEAESSGGFLPPDPALPSPPVPLSASTSEFTVLPLPRTHPLKPGTPKADAVSAYVEGRLLYISGRYERRFERMQAEGRGRARAREGSTADLEPQLENESDKDYAETEEDRSIKPKETVDHEEEGYASYAEAALDLGKVVDILWITASSSLQIPFFLSLALSAGDYLPSFPFAPAPTFTLFAKLDAAFAQLLGESSDQNDVVATRGRSLTMTEKIRLRGIVETTRRRVAEAASGDDWDETFQKSNISNGKKRKIEDTQSPRKKQETESSTLRSDVEVQLADVSSRYEPKKDGEEDDKGDDYDGDWDNGSNGSNDDTLFISWEMQVARLYERTIVALGSLLDAKESIGISTG